MRLEKAACAKVLKSRHFTEKVEEFLILLTSISHIFPRAQHIAIRVAISELVEEGLCIHDCTSWSHKTPRTPAV